jgi:hypothetical protein
MIQQMTKVFKFRVFVSALLLALLALSIPVASQTEQQPDKSDNPALHQALVDLTNPWTVMCVAAHPDDEDGSTLTVLRRKYGVHTVSLFSTFGEGGQNAVGPELYEDLGVIRARETMAASECKAPNRTSSAFAILVSRNPPKRLFARGAKKSCSVAWCSTFDACDRTSSSPTTTTTSGHGHHQATAGSFLQAFDAAADPKQFPEQSGARAVWQVQRLFVRNRGQGRSTSNGQPRPAADRDA